MLKKEIEDVLKKNSLLKAEIDALTVNNESSQVQIGELKEHISKLHISFDERETELDRVKKEYNERLGNLSLKEGELNKDLRLVEEYQNALKNRDDQESINMAVKPLIERVNNLNKELNDVNINVIKKEVEIAKLRELLDQQPKLMHCDSPNYDFIVKEENIPVKERLVSSFVVDKEILKAMERKKLLSCNCGLLNKVKVVEIQRENKEEVVRLTNENNLLNLKLKHAERVVEEQNVMVEDMKGCISILKRKVK